MPIRLNLLAEAQAAEELRRRDPVKRALWLAALLVAVALAWSGWLQLRILRTHARLVAVEKDIAVRTNEFQQVLEFQNQTTDIETKLAALHQLATNRFLNGTLLDALQHAIVDGVQLTRLKVDQNYVLTEETKAKKTDSGRRVPGKPATATEKIVVTLEAKDASANPGGDEMLRFKEKIAGQPYFQAMLGKTNEVRMIGYSQPQVQPDGGRFVKFTLECRFPEITR
jgi:hypothetical protein